MKALSLHSHSWNRRLALVIVVLALLALPLLVYVLLADNVVNWTTTDAETGAAALASAQMGSTTLYDRVELASSVTGGRASGLKDSSGGPAAPLAATSVVTYTLNPPNPDGSNGWYRNPVTVIWAWYPALPDTPPPCPAVDVPNQPPTSFECQGVRTKLIQRDGLKPNPPTIVAKKYPVGGDPSTATLYTAGTWTNQNVILTFTQAGDNGASGVDFCNPTSGSKLIDLDEDFDETGDCVDKAGNISDNATLRVKRDTKGPIGVATVDPAPNSYGWNKPPTNLSWTWTDPLPGVGTLGTPCTPSSSVTVEGINNYPTSTQTVVCYDALGNPGRAIPISVKLDKTPPYYSGIPSATSNGSAYTRGTWTRYPVVVSFNCTDALSGPVTNPVVVQWSQEGANQTVTADAALCIDKAGLTSSPPGASYPNVYIDMTPPNPPTVVISPQPNGLGWNHDHQVTATFVSAGDAGLAQSGVVSCSAPVTLTAETKGTEVKGTCTDAAGNVSAPASKIVKIDFTPPYYVAANSGTMAAATTSMDGITAFSNGKPYTANTWTNAPVEVRFACSDNLSEPQIDPVIRQFDKEGDNWYATAVKEDCKDYADNVAQYDSRTFGPIKIDMTKPNAPAVVLDPPANSNGWNNTPVTVSFKANGDGGNPPSGVVSCSAPVSLTEETVGTDLTGTCKDNAGNVSDSKTVTVRIDKTVPIINVITPPGGVLSGCLAKPEYTVDASISGLASATMEGPTLAIGANGAVVNRYTITAVDLAGNTATKTVDYLAYMTNDPFFLAPLDPTGKTLFKLGSTVSIKFQLLDCKGQIVSVADPRLRIDYLGPAEPQSDVPPATKVEGGDTGDKFRYTDGYWSYNWSTKGVWTGDYKLSVKVGGVVLRTITIGLR